MSVYFQLKWTRKHGFVQSAKTCGKCNSHALIFLSCALLPCLSTFSHLWKLHDESVRICLLCSGDDVIHGDVRPAVAYVLSDGGGEQHRLLLHDANQGTQPLDVQPSDVMTVQGHLRWRPQRAGAFAKDDG